MNIDLHHILLSGVKEHVFAEICLKEDNGYSINSIVAKMNKGNLIIHEKKEGVTSMEEFVKQIPAHIPVHFYISGSGIISRILEKDSSLPDKEVDFGELFPTIVQDEVYYTTNDLNGIAVINLIRRDKLDAILAEIKSLSVHCIYLEIGMGVVGILGNYLTTSELHFRSTLLKFIQGKLDGFSKSSDPPKPVCVGDEIIQQDQILTYAGALHYYEKKENNTPSNELTVLIQGLRNDYLFQRLFSKGWKSGLLFVFILLLANFLMFNSYSDKNNQLRQQQNMLDQNLQKKRESQSRQLKLQEIFNACGFQHDYHYARYMDDLSNDLHSGMSLTRVEMNPEIQKGNRKASFTFNRVRVQGTTSNANILNTYVNRILSNSWVSDVSIHTIDGSSGNAAMYFDLDMLLAE